MVDCPRCRLDRLPLQISWPSIYEMGAVGVGWVRLGCHGRWTNRQSSSLLHQRPVIGGGFDSHRMWQVIARLTAPMRTSAHPFCFFLLLLLIWTHKPVRSSDLVPI